MSMSLTTTSKASSRKMLVTKVKFFTENPALRRPSRLPTERGGPRTPGRRGDGGEEHEAQAKATGRGRARGQTHSRTSSHPGRALASLLPPDIPNYDLERTKMDVLAKSLFSNSTKIRTFGRRKFNRGCAAFAGF